MYLEGRHAFVRTVVPLVQIGLAYGVVQAREFRCPFGTAQRAGEREGEVPPGEQRGEGLGLLFATLGEGQVGPAGVLTGHAPLGLAVADQQEVSHDGYFADSTAWPPN